MDRSRVLTGSLIVAAFLAGCRTPGYDSAGLKDNGTASGVPMIRRIERDRLDVSTLPSVRMSEVWLDLAARAGGPQSQLEFLTSILVDFLPMLKGADLTKIIADSFGMQEQAANALTSGLPTGNDQALAAALAARLKTIIEKDPTGLDRFPTIRLSMMTDIQQALFALGKYQDQPPAPRAFRIDAASQPVLLRARGCSQPPPKIAPLLPENGLEKKWFPISEQIVPCFHENNDQLARALNVLSNLAANESPSLDVIFDPAGDGSGLAAKTVTSYEELLTLFSEAGIETEVYLKRQVANFLGLYYTSGGTSKTVRSPVWFGADIKGSLIRIPSEHSEVAMVFHKDGQRLAQVRYYLGTPAHGFENTPSFWRPVFEYDALWSIGEYESVRTVEPKKLVNEVRSLLYGTAKAMLAYQAVHDRFRLPANAYGIFVCSDSVVTAVAASETLSQGKISDRRATSAFPLLRMNSFTPPGNKPAIDVERMVAIYAGIDPDKFDKTYPSDIALQANDSELQARLQTAFSPAVDERYVLYPEFISQLKDEVRN